MNTEELNENVEQNVEETQATEAPQTFSVNDDGDYVINRDTEDAIQEQETESVSLGEQTGDSEEVDGSVRLGDQEGIDQAQNEEENVVELGQVSDTTDSEEDTVSPEVNEVKENEDFDLPEGWDKMVQFIKDNPGATPEDYVKLNSWDAQFSNEEILKQKLAKENGLDAKDDAEEINFLYEDKFGFDEDLDEERDIKLKKIDMKKALNEAKADLAKQKEDYLGSLTFKDQSPEVKEALKFYQESKEAESKGSTIRTNFIDNTDKLFSDEFKGFEFKYGENKAQRIKVGKVSEVKEFQSDVNNFFNKHVAEDGTISDVEAYHKALWIADNADAVISHFYEQGRADAVKESAKKAKNIDMGSRSDVGSITDDSNKPKFKLVDNNDDGFKLKFKK